MRPAARGTTIVHEDRAMKAAGLVDSAQVAPRICDGGRETHDLTRFIDHRCRRVVIETRTHAPPWRGGMNPALQWRARKGFASHTTEAGHMKYTQRAAAWLMLYALLVIGLPALAETAPAGVVQCILCHGTEGRGNEQVAAPRIGGMEHWYLERQLEAFQKGWRGVHESDVAGAEMRPSAVALDAEGVADIARYFADLPLEHPAPTLTGDAQRGQTLYSSCVMCHGARGEGNEGLGAPALAGQSDWYLARQLRHYRDGIRGTHPADVFGQQMVAMMLPLRDDRAVTDVVAYISSLNGQLAEE